jgi:parallel beta-helix repeat protein
MAFYLDETWPQEKKAEYNVSDFGLCVLSLNEPYELNFYTTVFSEGKSPPYNMRYAWPGGIIALGRMTDNDDPNELSYFDAHFSDIKVMSVGPGLTNKAITIGGQMKYCIMGEDCPTPEESTCYDDDGEIVPCEAQECFYYNGYLPRQYWPQAPCVGTDNKYSKLIKGDYTIRNIYAVTAEAAIGFSNSIDSTITIGGSSEDKIVYKNNIPYQPYAVGTGGHSGSTINVSYLDSYAGGVISRNGSSALTLHAWGAPGEQPVPAEPAQYSFTNNTVRMWPAGYGFFLGDYYRQYGLSDKSIDVELKNNIIDRRNAPWARRGIWLISAKDALISGNEMYGELRQSIYLQKAKNITVSDNTIKGTSSSIAMYVRDTSDSTITGNTIEDYTSISASWGPISLRNGDKNTVANNNFINVLSNGVGRGAIFLRSDSNDNTIQDNDYSDSGLLGWKVSPIEGITQLGAIFLDEGISGNTVDETIFHAGTDFCDQVLDMTMTSAVNGGNNILYSECIGDHWLQRVQQFETYGNLEELGEDLDDKIDNFPYENWPTF